MNLTTLNKTNSAGNIKLILLVILIFALVAIGSLLWHKKNSDAPTMVTIVSVTPNYTAIQIPTTQCRDVTVSKQVKNPNSNFFNNLFDSKSHPKYIEQNSKKRECNTVMTESQIINNYTINYQVANYIESMVIQTPLAVNSVMPLTALQQYQKESTISSNSENLRTLQPQASAPQ